MPVSMGFVQGVSVRTAMCAFMARAAKVKPPSVPSMKCRCRRDSFKPNRKQVINAEIRSVHAVDDVAAVMRRGELDGVPLGRCAVEHHPQDVVEPPVVRVDAYFPAIDRRVVVADPQVEPFRDRLNKAFCRQRQRVHPAACGLGLPYVSSQKSSLFFNAVAFLNRNL